MRTTTYIDQLRASFEPFVLTALDDHHSGFSHEGVPAFARPGELEFLQDYAQSKYAAEPDRVTHTADNVIFTLSDEGEAQVLLIRRKNHPFKGFWSLPGGFVDPHEAPSTAAARELQEETGVAVEDMVYVPVGVYGTPWRDPRLKNVHSHAFFTILPVIPAYEASDDAEDVQLFSVKTVQENPNMLGFDHELIIRHALIQVGVMLDFITVDEE